MRTGIGMRRESMRRSLFAQQAAGNQRRQNQRCSTLFAEMGQQRHRRPSDHARSRGVRDQLSNAQPFGVGRSRRVSWWDRRDE